MTIVVNSSKKKCHWKTYQVDMKCLITHSIQYLVQIFNEQNVYRTRKTQGRRKEGKKGGEIRRELGGQSQGREGEDLFTLILLHWHGCHWATSNGYGSNFSHRWKDEGSPAFFWIFSSIKFRFDDVALFTFYFW